MRDLDVAIVGAGPAGLVLALLLARSGRRVAVLEQATTFEREYRGEGIQPGTRRIFADLGLRERIEHLDYGSPQGCLARIDGRELRFGFAAFLGDDPAARPIFVPQPLLLEILADEARRASAEIVLGATFKALRYCGGRVAGLEASDRTGVRVSIDARLVVACDGRFSAVRRSAGVELTAASVPYDLLWFSTSAPGAANDLVYVQSEGANLTIAFPSRRRRLQVGWLVPKDAPRPGRDELIRRAPPEAARLLRDELESGAEPVLLPIASEVVTAWWRPGLLLIGDAAHPMSPVAAQGINVAVQDAVVAARHLADANDEAALDRALPHIERERTGSIHRIARQQNAFVLALHRIGPARAVYFGISAAIAVERIGLFPFIGRPLLDRFLWGDPPIRADAGPWSLVAKDSSIGAR